MKSLVALLALILVEAAEARTFIQCNKRQTKCLTENSRLSIGDQVGIFNRDGMLVAEGEVTALRGERRTLKIERRHGTIRDNDSLALLEQDKAFGSGSTLSPSNVYREPTALSVGGSLAMGNISIAESSPVFEMSGYGAWRLLGSAQTIMRAVFQRSEGGVAGYREGQVGLETLPIQVTGIGLLGGLSHTSFRMRKISIRTEAGLGTMRVDAKVDGTTDLAEDKGFKTHIENGFQAYGRGTFGGVVNFDEWHLSGDFVFSLVNNAYMQALAFGVSRDLD